jgi:bleomycin hydrolase
MKELDLGIIKNTINMNNNNNNELIMNACNENSINKITLNSNKVDTNFTDLIENVSGIMDQYYAGICWLCASYNMCRGYTIKKLNIKSNFNYSLNYLFFWDKMEKCNNFMEYIIKNRNKHINSNKLKSILWSPCSDGGYWYNFVHIVNKYGLIPDNVYERRHHSKYTHNLNYLLKHKLREFASKIISPNENREEIEVDKILDIKNKYLQIITNIMIKLLGKPLMPDDKFSWIYTDKDKNKIKIKNITPLEFYREYSGIEFNNYVPIMNDPRKRHPYYKTYKQTIISKINCDKIKPYVLLNLPNEDIKVLLMKQIDIGIPIWFSCDVDKYSNESNNLLDTQAYNYNILFDTNFDNMSKADRLDFCDSYACHAMSIIGYDLDIIKKKKKKDKKKKKKVKKKKKNYEKYVNKINKYKVQNSWGSYGKLSGCYLMTNEWMKMYGYEYIIDKSLLNKKQLKALKEIPIVLNSNDSLSKIYNPYQNNKDNYSPPRKRRKLN